MASVNRPRIVRFDRCHCCGAVVWRCRIRGGGTMVFDPRPRAEGRFEAQADGRLRLGVSDGLVSRYEVHHRVCAVARQRAHQRDLTRAIEQEVTEAVEEGRLPLAAGQLWLFHEDPIRGASGYREGWIDLTRPHALSARPGKRWNGVVVVDLRSRPDPPRPN
jgi:hypothetical protein